jgi:hypothetical protein
VAKEAALIELYRQDRITAYELAQALKLSRLEADALLKRHNVTEDLPTESELELDRMRLRRLGGRSSSFGHGNGRGGV